MGASNSAPIGSEAKPSDAFSKSQNNGIQEGSKDTGETTSKMLDYASVLGPETLHNARRHIRGYWVGKDTEKLHAGFADPTFGKQLSTFLQNENCSSAIDMGAGDGSYSQAIANCGIFVNCYDGNPDTQTISNGRCAVLDFSQSLNLPSRYDWVLSLKVGKHIPKEHEETFFRNMDKLNTKGVIINWGGSREMTPDTPDGVKYFNQKPDSYVIEKFISLGYVQDLTAQKYLRNGATTKTLRERLLVFRRQETESKF